jgi:hypothetical protein
VIEQLGEVLGEALDPIGAFRLVGTAMAAAVIDEHRGLVGEHRRHRIPKRVVHAERVDEHHRRRILELSADFVDELHPVAEPGPGHRHFMQP